MATPVFCCGFECGVTAAHWTLAAAASFNTGTVRSGTRSLRVNPSSASAEVSNIGWTTAINTIVGRFYVRWASLPLGTCSVGGAWFATGNIQGAFFDGATSKIKAGYATNTIGTTGITVTTGVWYRIDVYVNSSANPHTIDVSVDGVACSQLTRAVAASTTNRFGLATNNGDSYDAFFDDVLVSSASGDYPLGAGYVNHFIPTSDGTHNVAGAADFKRGAAGTDILNATTDSYLLIDSVPLDTVAAAPPTNDYINAIAPPNATDYVEHIFGNAAGISTPTTAPRAVEVIIETAQAATQTGSYKVNINDNGTVALVKETVGVAGVVNVAAASKQFATAPTGGAWTVVSGAGNFLNLRSRFYSADAAPDQYLVNIMVEAEFVVVAPADPSYIGGTGMMSLGVGDLGN